MYAIKKKIIQSTNVNKSHVDYSSGIVRVSKDPLIRLAR